MIQNTPTTEQSIKYLKVRHASIFVSASLIANRAGLRRDNHQRSLRGENLSRALLE
jgi:hypothetical protein